MGKQVSILSESYQIGQAYVRPPNAPLGYKDTTDVDNTLLIV